MGITQMSIQCPRKDEMTDFWTPTISEALTDKFKRDFEYCLSPLYIKGPLRVEENRDREYMRIF